MVLCTALTLWLVLSRFCGSGSVEARVSYNRPQIVSDSCELRLPCALARLNSS